MTEETIKISADVKDAVKKIGELTKAVEDLTKQNEEQSKALETALQKNAKAGEKQIGVLKKLRGAVGKVGKGFKGLGLVFKGLGFGILIKLVDQLVDKFKENQKIVDIFNGVGETLSIVLKKIMDIMTPIIQQISDATGGFDALKKVIGGALQVAINTFLIAIQGVSLGVQSAQLAWEKSFFGGKDADKIKELQSGIDETKEKIGQTADRIKESGKQIADNFVEAVGEVGSLVQGVAEGASQAVEEIDLKAAYTQGQALARQKKNFELQALQQQRLVEEYDRAAEELRQIRDDETLSISERMQANEDLGKVLEEQNAAEKETVQARIDAIQAEIDAKGASVELTNELFSLNTELAAVDAKVAGFKSEQLTNQNALIKEQNELTQSQKESEVTLDLERKRFFAEQEQNELKRLELMRTVLEEEKVIELERLQSKIDTYALGTQARIDAEVEYNERKQALDLELADNENQINAVKSKNEIDWANLTEEEKLQIASQGFKNLASILGEESAAGKAAAIAAATIDTYQSANSSYKSLSGIPIVGPAFGAVAAGAAIVSGIATVKKIASTKTPGKSGGGGASVSAPSRSTPQSAPPAFNVVGAASGNQLADALAEQEKKPVKAYVTSGDVTTSQSLERNIVEGASI